MRRNLIKIIILGALILLTPISFMLGRRRRSAKGYYYCDTPGENISLPAEVSGQRGSEVCASPDGQFIAVAGNRVIPQDIFEGKKSEPAFTLLAYKHFICLSSNFGRSFESVYASLRSGVIASMALSPVNPRQIAFISVEFQTNFPVPESEGEMHRMAQDPKLRAKIAEDYAHAREVRDLDVALYILDTEKKEPPRMLCTLDNCPLKFTGKPKTDLSRFNESQLKWLNEMKSFRESGIYLSWEVRLKIEKELKSVTWLPDGSALLVADGFSIMRVDLSGTKTSFYAPDPENTHTLGNFSNPYCRTNGDVLLAEYDRSGGNSNWTFYLTRLDVNGNVLSKTQGAFSYISVPFDESPAPLIGEHKIAITGNKPENMHSAVLRTSALSPNVDDWKDTVDWWGRSKTYDIYDSNRVQFYYMPKVFINDGDEILLFKRRAHLLARPKSSTNWEATPYTPENAAAPWVELRKMKIG